MTINDTVSANYDDQDRMILYGNASYVYTINGDLRYKIMAHPDSIGTGSDTTKYYYRSEA